MVITLRIPRLLVFLVVYCVAFVAQATESQSLQKLDGSLVKIEGQREKPLYVKFWATWCPECRAQMPHLQALYENHGDRIDIVAVNIGFNETIETVYQYREQHKLTVPMAFEPDIWLAKLLNVPIMTGLNIPVVPYSIVIDRNGTVVHHTPGITGLDDVIERQLQNE
jgi:thiol-disulfide isomerase/thioredoxin